MCSFSFFFRTSVWSGCTKWKVLPQAGYSQSLQYTSPHILLRPVTQATQSSLSHHHGTLGLKNLMLFNLIFTYFSPKLEKEYYFFFDSLSCLVSPVSFFNILPFGCQNDGARDATLLLRENNWHTAVRPWAHWVMRAISSRILLKTKDKKICL